MYISWFCQTDLFVSLFSVYPFWQILINFILIFAILIYIIQKWKEEISFQRLPLLSTAGSNNKTLISKENNKSLINKEDLTVYCQIIMLSKRMTVREKPRVWLGIPSIIPAWSGHRAIRIQRVWRAVFSINLLGPSVASRNYLKSHEISKFFKLRTDGKEAV